MVRKLGAFEHSTTGDNAGKSSNEKRNHRTSAMTSTVRIKNQAKEKMSRPQMEVEIMFKKKLNDQQNLKNKWRRLTYWAFSAISATWTTTSSANT